MGTPPNWFIGLPITDTGWLEALVTGAPPGARVFAPGDLHATVAFLGAVDEATARRAWAVACGDVPRQVEARFGPVEAFGSPRRPSAFALTFAQGREALADMLKARGGAMRRAAGLEPERRAPRPHVSLVRPTRKATDAQRRAIAAWATGLTPPDALLHLDRLALYTWASQRRDQLFRIVEALPLT